MPQLLEHSLNADHPPLTGQACVLQFAVPLPSHVAPPFAGAGEEHVRDFDPVPQLLEHSLNADHPPLTGVGSAHCAPACARVRGGRENGAGGGSAGVSIGARAEGSTGKCWLRRERSQTRGVK